MLNLVLVEPEIPQNCGNIARTCVLTGSRLHLVGPLGFDVSDSAVRRNMKRCGLDYWPRLDLRTYRDLDDFFAQAAPEELWLATTKAPLRYDRAAYRPDCWLMFGKESAGLPKWLRERYRERCVRIPMRPEERSLNLSNSVAVLAYEALRQLDFPGLSEAGEMAAPQQNEVSKPKDFFERSVSHELQQENREGRGGKGQEGTSSL